MKVLHAVHQRDFVNYNTAMIRESFLLDDLVRENEAVLVYTHYDRMIAGTVSPAGKAVPLGNYPELRADHFLERREMGIINVGGAGGVRAGGQVFPVNKLDCLYIGKGTEEVEFESVSEADPAVFFVLSSPAHRSFQTTLMTGDQAEKGDMGSLETSNQRSINRYIHKHGIQSCQLVMGLTQLKTGSVWNTMPSHVHDRRMEVYFYFDVPEGQRVFHYMGQPQETRHIVMANREAVVSPPWSIHSGGGTSNYSFIWGMCGENLEYGDMDPVALADIR